jgi:hypothetical protein
MQCRRGWQDFYLDFSGFCPANVASLRCGSPAKDNWVADSTIYRVLRNARASTRCVLHVLHGWHGWVILLKTSAYSTQYWLPSINIKLLLL